VGQALVAVLWLLGVVASPVAEYGPYGAWASVAEALELSCSTAWGIFLEKEMATHSGIFAWEIPWTEEPGGYSPWGGKELDMTEQLNNKNNAYSGILVGGEGWQWCS